MAFSVAAWHEIFTVPPLHLRLTTTTFVKLYTVLLPVIYVVQAALTIDVFMLASITMLNSELSNFLVLGYQQVYTHTRARARPEITLWEWNRPKLIRPRGRFVIVDSSKIQASREINLWQWTRPKFIHQRGKFVIVDLSKVHAPVK